MSSGLRARGPAQNLLISALPPSKHHSLLSNLERLSLSLGEDLFPAEGRRPFVYFPINCVVSFLYTTREGATAETGLTGNEGMVGLASLLGGGTRHNRAVVQIAGDAWRLSAKTLRDEFAQGDALQDLLLRYTQVLLTQISQTAVCNRLHRVERRLCRRLLLYHDRVDSDVLPMTQEFIANLLGGRRESITVAAGRLQNAGLIRYSRGHIKILSRSGLESAACECYGVVRNEEDRLLGAYRAENHWTSAANRTRLLVPRTPVA
jgi:CRP-like cAMP-binding protein